MLAWYDVYIVHGNESTRKTKVNMYRITNQEGRGVRTQYAQMLQDKASQLRRDTVLTRHNLKVAKSRTRYEVLKLARELFPNSLYRVYAVVSLKGSGIRFYFDPMKAAVYCQSVLGSMMEVSDLYSNGDGLKRVEVARWVDPAKVMASPVGYLMGGLEDES